MRGLCVIVMLCVCVHVVTLDLRDYKVLLCRRAFNKRNCLAGQTQIIGVKESGEFHAKVMFHCNFTHITCMKRWCHQENYHLSALHSFHQSVFLASYLKVSTLLLELISACNL